MDLNSYYKNSLMSLMIVNPFIMENNLCTMFINARQLTRQTLPYMSTLIFNLDPRVLVLGLL